MDLADESGLLLFYDLDHGGFRRTTTTFGKELYFHFVTVHGMCRISFGNENGRSAPFGNKRIAAIEPTLKSAYDNQSQGIVPIASALYLMQDVIHSHVFHQGVHH